MLISLINKKKYQLKLYIGIKLISMLKAVLFDMDGVIVDIEPLHQKAYLMMFKEVGVDVSK